MQRWLPVLLVALLVIPAVQAQSDAELQNRANPRDPYPVPGTVNDVVVAPTGAYFGAANDDGGNLAMSNQPVYHLWQKTASPDFPAVSEPADPAGCHAPLPTDDCVTDALVMATNEAGTRLAAATFISVGQGTLVAFDGPGIAQRTIGSDNNPTTPGDTEIEGKPCSIAMDGVGNRVILATTGASPAASAPTCESAGSGHIYVFGWGGNSIPIDGHVQTGAAATSVAVSKDGAVAVASAGRDHYRFNPTNLAAAETHLLPATSPATHVAISDTEDHWSIVGTADGKIGLYADGGGTGTEFFGSLFSSTVSVSSVAFSSDGSVFAAGGSNGRVAVYRFDEDSLPGTRIGEITVAGSAVRDLSLSADGSYLVAAAGNDVWMYRVLDDSVVPVWFHRAMGAAGRVAIDATGELVVSGHGSAVTVYDPIHDIVGTAPAGTVAIDPGQARNLTYTYQNRGNRWEEVALAASAPSGWTTTVDPTTFELAPGASRTVQVRTAVPQHQAPGSYDIVLTHTLGSGGTGTTTGKVGIPTLADWNLEVDGASSLSIESGTPAVFSLTVTNEGNQQDSTAILVSGLPSGWTATTTPGTVNLGPGASATVQVQVSAPPNADQLEQATFTVRLGDKVTEQAQLTATVGARFGAALDVPSSVSVTPGESSSFQVTVENTGNAPDGFQLSLGNVPAGWTAAFANGLSTLNVQSIAAGNDRSVSVSVQAPATAEANTQVQLTVSAASLGDPQQQASRNTIFAVQAATTGPDGEGTGIPGFPVVFVLLAVVAALVARRRSG